MEMKADNYNVNDCKYCLYWAGKKTGGTDENGCCCDEPQHPKVRNGVPITETKVTKNASRHKGGTC